MTPMSNPPKVKRAKEDSLIPREQEMQAMSPRMPPTSKPALVR